VTVRYDTIVMALQTLPGKRSHVASRPSATVLGLVFGALAALGWGVSLAAARHAISEGLSPIDLAFIRYSISGPLLATWSAFRWKDRTNRISFGKACALAMLAGPPLTICVIGGTRSAPFTSGVLVEVASLAVACIVTARCALKEPLDALRRIALCLLTARIAFIAGPTLLFAGIQEQLGIVLFAAAGCMSAAFTALVCRWRIAPIRAMALVSFTSFASYGPLYMWNEGLGRLSQLNWTLILEQIVSQGLIAGIGAWIAFIYSARLLGLVRATFLPAITPAVAVLLSIILTSETPTLEQLSIMIFSAMGAILLVLRVR
jgi:drug/metabolite transporter (DMT)-like permease